VYKRQCLHCPLKDSCLALQKGLVKQLPIKLKKTKIKKRYFNYLVPVYHKDSAFTRLQKRDGKGIWQNLWEFPLLESTESLHLKNIESQYKNVLKDINAVSITQYNEKPIVHKLSHQHLFTHFWIVETNNLTEDKIKVEKLNEYPVPVLIADFLKAFKF